MYPNLWMLRGITSNLGAGGGSSCLVPVVSVTFLYRRLALDYAGCCGMCCQRMM
jgi:hypothetical protein